MNGSFGASTRGLTVRLGLLAALLLAATSTTAGVVGDGTPGSCTSAALNAQIALGGTVTFSCGGAIVIPNVNLFAAGTNPTTVIDGAGNVTLDGGGSGPIAVVDCAAGSLPDITFRNLAFRNGNTTTGSFAGGAIQNSGKLTLDSVSFTLNAASGGGGAIYQVGGTVCPLPSATIGYSTFASNQTGGYGGAIRVEDGTMTIHDSDFSSNVAGAAGGAIYLGLGGTPSRSLSISNGHFHLNQALAGHGGAIYGATGGTGTVAVDSSTFTNNSCSGATFSGGAINVARTGLDIGGSLFQLNTSHDSSAGAVWAEDGTVAVRDTTFTQNGAANPGGSAGAVALVNVTGTFQRSTFKNNVVWANGVGAAMTANGTVGIENCTLSGNTATGTGSYAGTIYVQSGTTEIRNCTITGNSAPSYGGIFVAGSGTLRMRNSILAGNTATGGGNPDLAVNGTFASNGYNMIGSSSGITVAPTDIINPNPDLGALANNGGPNFGNVVIVGPTFTHLPNAGSPVIDGGDPAGCLALGGGALTTDQRNMSRPSPTGGRCDIGAVEVQVALPATKLAFAQQPTNAVAGATITPAVTVQLQDAGGASVPTNGVSITLALASGTGTLSGTTTQVTDGTGLATFSGLSVNVIGTKTLSASASGLTGATSSSFVISAGAAASLVISGGNSQHTLVGTPFGSLLMVTVTDSLGNPVSGASVTFTAPGSGASAAVAGSPDTTAADGVASVAVTANGVPGSYAVVASSGTLAPVSFALTNDPAAAETNNVPALGPFGLVLLALAISGAGCLFVRRIG